MAIAYRCLRHLCQQGLGITQEQSLHRAGAEEFLFEQMALET